MKRCFGILAGCALAVAMSATSAFADCAEDLASLKADGIAKDGTHAPLNGASDQAMSAQDVQAQQKGGETAAQEAETAVSDHDAALEQAEAALRAGDEAGCLAAVKEAGTL